MFSIFDEDDFPLSEKVSRLNWLLVLLILMLGSIGMLMLYSAAGGSFYPWVMRQGMFFAIFFCVMLIIALSNISIWFNMAYYFYALALLLVLLVDITGHTAMGATRWFSIGFVKIQPSEIMKVGVVLALARYFYKIDIDNIGEIKYVIIPSLIILVPGFLVFVQPDLGSAAILVLVGVMVMFVSGVRVWKFVAVGILVLAAAPSVWFFGLYDYQRDRVINFLNPQNDPLGTGYNIIQSKIAIGSGGLTGKGYLHGTQAQLDFLPEKQTDFIFTMISEELGFIGSVTTIVLFMIVVLVCIRMSYKIGHQYGRILCIGIASIFFVHGFVNMGMVMGLLPVVGAPLPLISYGGTVTASILIGFGFVLNCDLYADRDLERMKIPGALRG